MSKKTTETNKPAETPAPRPPSPPGGGAGGNDPEQAKASAHAKDIEARQREQEAAEAAAADADHAPDAASEEPGKFPPPVPPAGTITPSEARALPVVEGDVLYGDLVVTRIDGQKVYVTTPPGTKLEGTAVVSTQDPDEMGLEFKLTMAQAEYMKTRTEGAGRRP